MRIFSDDLRRQSVDDENVGGILGITCLLEVALARRTASLWERDTAGNQESTAHLKAFEQRRADCRIPAANQHARPAAVSAICVGSGTTVIVPTE